MVRRKPARNVHALFLATRKGRGGQVEQRPREIEPRKKVTCLIPGVAHARAMFPEGLGDDIHSADAGNCP